jgi:glycosyltransferase involved in cell wall biosynthesis
MLILLRALRRCGHRVELACPEPPDPGERSLLLEARRAGIEPLLLIGRGRGVGWRRDTPDVNRLARLLAECEIGIVHTWHTRDHAMALRAAGRRRRAGRTRLIRSHSGADPIRRTPWNRWLFGPGCDGLLCVSPKTARGNARLRGGRPLAGCLGAVDAARFDLPVDREAVRAGLGLAPESPVIGIVARVQRHRRFELLFQAIRRLSSTHPAARLLVLGRGTHFDQVARRPVERLGLADRVVLAGYRQDDYPAAMRCMDLFTFLVPGSDGTCRALLESAACGIPAVTTRRRPLPEIVVEGETGLLVEEDPEALAAAWRRLLVDPEERRRLGKGARRRAEALFTPERLAREVERLYRTASSSSQE